MAFENTYGHGGGLPGTQTPHTNGIISSREEKISLCRQAANPIGVTREQCAACGRILAHLGRYVPDRNFLVSPSTATAEGG